MHSPQAIQRLGRRMGSGCGDWLSGLWHHQQFSGQPFRNTVVRIPGPSWTEYFRISKIIPVNPDIAPPGKNRTFILPERPRNDNSTTPNKPAETEKRPIIVVCGPISGCATPLFHKDLSWLS